MNIALYVILGLVALTLLFFVIPTMYIAVRVYCGYLVRTSKKKWDRSCSYVVDDEQVRMYDQGIAWAEENKAAQKPVDVYSGKYHLFGEYFDFGFKKAVIIIAGRSEGCTYSYYFAKPYKESGFNVLVIDNRAHGLSDGRYNCVGIKEYADIIAWAKLLHDDLNNESVICHGICIGSAAALYAMTCADAPDYLNGLVAEGMFMTFYESFRNHMIADKRPLFPVLGEVMLLMRIFSGVNVKKHGPVYCINKMKKPVLFLHSKADKFSLPETVPSLYEMCGGPKQLVWFEKGAHSHIRINNEADYDKAIIDFAGKYF